MNDGKRFAFTLVAATLLWAAWLIWKGLPSNEIKGLLNQWVVPAFVMTGIGWIVVYRVYRKGLRRLQDDIGAKLVMVGEAQVIKVRRPGSHNQEVHLSDGMVLRGLAGMYQEYQVGVRVQYRISEEHLEFCKPNSRQ